MAKKTLKDLLDERALKFAAAEEAQKVGETENRNLTTDEYNKFSGLMEEVRALDKQIAQERSLEDFARARAASVGSGSEGNRDSSAADERDFSKYSLNRALLARLDNRSLDGVEAEVQKIAEARAKEDGIVLSGNGIVVLDSVLQKRGQTVTLQTANPGDQGGVTVPKDVRGVLEVLQANTFLDKVGARFMTGLSGDLEFPVQDTVPLIQELTEIEKMNKSEILFSTISLKPSRRGTTVPISRQLLIQSSIDMQNFVINAIGEALSQKMNAEAVAILLTYITSANGNLLALGTNGALPDYEDIVALEALVEGYNHDRGNPAYLTNSKVKAILKTTQIFTGTSGAPVWDTTGQLNGHKAVISNVVPSTLTKGTGTNLSPIFFGNFSDFLVGMWGGTEYVVDPYTRKEEALIEVTANAFWGMRPARVKSFAGIKDAITTRP
ncbi:phage major capsid protein [Dyadobacter sp. CY345]|uniref:phage major capsid protein n=1 Tax=Dyadobacter sp. CY345 TaxID=2909335 RepID=UPI001F314EF8|nr:phage major capsid protein [Dyadobacter sp. CY345]MCF2443647.1 phage major capsid protein [Dyadobacter sp. CY345]